MSRAFIPIGIPTHFTPATLLVATCGVACPQFHTEDIEEVNCRRCFKSRAFKKAAKGHKWSK